jgi:hypothetical protein
MPPTITIIGKRAFEYCQILTSIEIPNSITQIGEQAFYGCNSLKSIVIPSSVMQIGNEAFFNCSSLKSIEIPNSVTQIGIKAFWGCKIISSVYCHSKEPITCEKEIFSDEIFYTAVLYVPIGSKEKYCNSIPWYKFNNIVEKEMDD